ncbi:MAG: TIGR01212 family radical SAM protein [Helicobacter sp.]|uniref:TIGR01212 family radical SAM protein n=1 Tax=Helicobacter sp. 10-6591 TaxID=2004998 RepID=UPI000DCB8066|nr:TIGR01212 family radical SAM protein [Helicobacter sp. 10-6591]MCI6217225.1 TIGR01212 family radical SAM protein [Helicobacter sp.]MCI7484643.1 TIGR01212 family radical SAM protein [Helicobacter sp.]MDD7568158.1 TIGR01212 family radical SAM protein [Helicobacter sp.]MDY5740962.1 TIGR01212 family radical SAM protein [Helicobacter sp.]RAX53785.1 TIGR01212 family radical SAM protein [Helicobacter sp. 10-6591]
MRVVLTVGRYFRRHFGSRVRKIPISLQGFTCPNIDGSVAKGGCIYCENESFSPSLIKISKASPVKMNFSLTHNPLLPKQLEQLKEQFAWHSNFHNEKFGIGKYLVYFQSYTNTYAPFDTLKALYDCALGLPNVVGLSIGTRIDCVGDELLDLLGSYVKLGKEIWLEYGIQSVYNKTLEITNRGHGIEGAQELFSKTRQHGIKVCAHIIYGLPGEDESMMLHTLDSVIAWGIDGIKIHPMYVIAGTRLAQMFRAGEYTPIKLETFSDLIVQSLKKIPPSVVVQRISAGAHDETLLAPKWCFDKNIQMRYIRDKLREEGIEY